MPFGVSMAFPNQSLYTAKLSDDLRKMLQSGLMDKIVGEVSWEMQRSSRGQLLAVNKFSCTFLHIELEVELDKVVLLFTGC